MQSHSHHRALLVLLSAALALALVRRAREPIERVYPAPIAHSSRRSTAIIALNTASASELEALPGVGPRLAKRIVDERARRGGFRSVAELDAVRGVGPTLIARWANRLQIDSQIDGPARPGDQRDRVSQPAVEVEGGVGDLHAEP